MGDVNKIACEGIKKSNIKLLKDYYGIKCCEGKGELKKLLNLSILANNPDCTCFSKDWCEVKDMESCTDTSFYCPDSPEATPDIKYARCALQWNIFTYKIFDSNNQVVGDFRKEWEFIPDLSNFPGKTSTHSTNITQIIDRSFLLADALIKVTYIFDLQSDYDNLVTAFGNLNFQLYQTHKLKITGLDIILPYQESLLSMVETPASKKVVITLKKVPTISDFIPTDRLAFWGEFMTVKYDEIYSNLSLYSNPNIIETKTLTSFSIEKYFPSVNSTFDQTVTQNINGEDTDFHLIFKPDVGYNCTDSNDIFWLKDDRTQVKVY